MNRSYPAKKRIIDLTDDAILRREILLCQRVLYERYQNRDMETINRCRLVIPDMEMLHAEEAPIRDMWITDLVLRIQSILSIASIDLQQLLPRYINLGRLTNVKSPYQDHGAYCHSDNDVLPEDLYPMSYNNLSNGMSIRVMGDKDFTQSAVLARVAAHAGLPMIIAVTFGTIVTHKPKRYEMLNDLRAWELGDTENTQKLLRENASEISRSISSSSKMKDDFASSDHNHSGRYVHLLKEIGALRVEPTSGINDAYRFDEDNDLKEENEWTRSTFRKYFFGHNFGKPIHARSMKSLCKSVIVSPERKRELTIKVANMKSHRSTLNRVFRGGI